MPGGGAPGRNRGTAGWKPWAPSAPKDCRGRSAPKAPPGRWAPKALPGPFRPIRPAWKDPEGPIGATGPEGLEGPAGPNWPQRPGGSPWNWMAKWRLVGPIGVSRARRSRRPGGLDWPWGAGRRYLGLDTLPGNPWTERPTGGLAGPRRRTSLRAPAKPSGRPSRRGRHRCRASWSPPTAAKASSADASGLKQAPLAIGGGGPLEDKEPFSLKIWAAYHRPTSFPWPRPAAERLAGPLGGRPPTPPTRSAPGAPRPYHRNPRRRKPAEEKEAAPQRSTGAPTLAPAGQRGHALFPNGFDLYASEAGSAS